MQAEILSKYPEAKLRVYVIWEPMLESDKKVPWKEGLITDSRAIHFHDAERVSGHWFAEKVKSCHALKRGAWDAFYLYGKDVKWADVPKSTLACGTPIIDEKEKLEEGMKKIFRGK